MVKTDDCVSAMDLELLDRLQDIRLRFDHKPAISVTVHLIVF